MKPLLLHTVLQTADLFATKIALKLDEKDPSIKEFNPIARHFTDSGNWKGLFLLKMSSVGIVWAMSKTLYGEKGASDPEFKKMINFVNVVYGVTVLNNVLAIIDLLKPKEFPYDEITSQDY